jgi:hypothetical protein
VEVMAGTASPPMPSVIMLTAANHRRCRFACTCPRFAKDVLRRVFGAI